MTGAQPGHFVTADRCSVQTNISSPRRRDNANRGPETQEGLAPMSYTQPYELCRRRPAGKAR